MPRGCAAKGKDQEDEATYFKSRKRTSSSGARELIGDDEPLVGDGGNVPAGLMHYSGRGREGVVVEGCTRDLGATQALHRIGNTWLACDFCRIIRTAQGSQNIGGEVC